MTRRSFIYRFTRTNLPSEMSHRKSRNFSAFNQVINLELSIAPYCISPLLLLITYNFATKICFMFLINVIAPSKFFSMNTLTMRSRDVECTLAPESRRIVRIMKFATLCHFRASYGKRVTWMGLAGYERRIEAAPWKKRKRERRSSRCSVGARATRTSILLSVAGRKCWIYDDGAPYIVAPWNVGGFIFHSPIRYLGYWQRILFAPFYCAHPSVLE